MAYNEVLATAVGQSLYGDGSDGNVVINAGTTTLTRDMYYNNLTVNGTGKLVTAGFSVRVAGVLDITACPADGITNGGANGGNAAGATAGSAGSAAAANTMPTGTGGTAGGAGGIGVTGSTSANPGAVNPAIGGAGAKGGANASGNAGTPGARTQFGNYPRFAAAYPLGVAWSVATGSATISTSSATAGQGSSGGSSGNSSASSTSGGGGGGPAGGNTVSLYARTINRGAGTAAGAISAKGGKGGDGAAGVLGAGTGACGGSAGAGAGGGWIWLVYEFLLGSVAANCLDASGGNSGIGAAGVGAGVQGGDAGTGGASGQIQAFNMNTGVSTIIAGNANAGTVGSAHVGLVAGTTPGVGGAATLSL